MRKAQFLSNTGDKSFELKRAHQAGDEQAFCRMFGVEKIAECVGEFLGYFMPRKVVAGEELLRASGTVVGKLVGWLAEQGAIATLGSASETPVRGQGVEPVDKTKVIAVPHVQPFAICGRR